MTRFGAIGAVTVLAAITAPVEARPTVSLDGVWEFRFCTDDRGEKEGWFRPGATFDRTLKVPGCWDAQGVGKEAKKVRHNAVGVGWHRRTFTVPADWTDRRVWLRVGAAHRSAKVWIDGKPLGKEHFGYPVAFEFDVTRFVTPGRRHTLVIAVDSRRHWERDTLTGAFDVIDFMDVDWGGIFEPVTLYATRDVWVGEVFVLPNPAANRARVKLTLEHVEEATLDSLSIRYDVRRWGPDASHGPALDSGRQRVGGKPSVEWDLHLRDAPLWTPETSHLLVLDLTLRHGNDVLDKRSIRFGQRLLEIRGSDFYLNGERFFFRGYGDDWTFPKDIMPPPDVAFWRRYLRKRKEFGLNGVRHHSTMVPEAYLTAADEVGIFVQPELPIAYKPFFDRANERGRDLYRYVWRTYIRQMRNHPSVFAWCMNNEIWGGFPLGPELYQVAKQLDPTRPVIDADGVGGDLNRPTIDYITLMFDVGSIPWGKKRGKFRMAGPPKKPVISHETSNISVLPDPGDISKYDGIVKPFWLEQMAAQIRKRGLAGYLDDMLAASRKLQASLIKLNIEAARLSPDVDGHHQWLFRDYWTQSTGLVNQFDEVRALTPAMARQFFGQVVVLWDFDRVNYWAGEAIPLRLFLSDFRPRSAEPRVDEIMVRIGTQRIALRAPESVGGRGLIGPWLGEATAPTVAAPRALTVRAQAGPVQNQWTVWVFNKPTVKPTAPDDLADVICTRWLSASAMDRLTVGRTVWVMDDDAVFPVIRGRFKPAWWKGNHTTDATYGNMILAHPALRRFPHDGYGDLQMAGLLDERPVVLTDDLPCKIEPVIWCLDVPWQMRPKAYLFEASVGERGGKLLFSTLNLSRSRRESDPAAEWLFGRLLEYVRSDEFRPKARLPIKWLRERVAQVGRPDPATWVEGFAKVLEYTEAPSPWYSYRQDKCRNYVVRQTDGKQKLRWRTAAVPKDWTRDTVTFVWAGGIGWRSEPGGGHFSLTLNGKSILDFPFVQKTTGWQSADRTVRLRYMVCRTVGVDSLGLFFLTVPTSSVGPGKPAELAVTATAQNSRRWFAINPYTDVVARERRAF